MAKVCITVVGLPRFEVVFGVALVTLRINKFSCCRIQATRWCCLEL